MSVQRDAHSIEQFYVVQAGDIGVQGVVDHQAPHHYKEHEQRSRHDLQHKDESCIQITAPCFPHHAAAFVLKSAKSVADAIRAFTWAFCTASSGYAAGGICTPFGRTSKTGESASAFAIDV